jgi:hypothetical protein
MKALTNMLKDGISPAIQVLGAAIKKVPAVKYAFGLAGIAAAIAIIKGLLVDWRVAVFGTIVMLILMAVLLVFAKLATMLGKWFIGPAITLMWFSLLLFIFTGSFLFTSVFFDWPLQLKVVVQPNVDHKQEDLKISVDGVDRQQYIVAYSSENAKGGPDIGGDKEVAFFVGDARSSEWTFQDDIFGGSAFIVDLRVNDDLLELIGVDCNTVGFQKGLIYHAAADGATSKGATPNIVLVVEIESAMNGMGEVCSGNLKTGKWNTFQPVPLRKGSVRIMIQLARQGVGRGEFDLSLQVRRTSDNVQKTLKLNESLKAAFIDKPGKRAADH